MNKRRASGEGSLTFDDQRGLWIGRLPRSIDPGRRAVYGRTQREARDKLGLAIRDSENGLKALTDRASVDVYLESWLGLVRSRVQDGRLAPSTAVGYERVVRRYLRPKLGRIPLRKLTPAHVESMLGELRAGGQAPATVRHVRATLSRSLSDAMRDQLVARNVARLVEAPHLERKNPSAFSTAEFRSIADTCSDDRLGPLFLFTANTGLRRSEVLGLRWRDVDLDAGTFQVSEGIHQVTGIAERVTGRTGLITSRPKTDASGNRLPMSRSAVELLREHHRSQAAERLACPQQWPDTLEDSHIFTTLIGTPLQPSNVARSWRRILDTAGVAHLTPDGRARGMHELRRTFATRLRDANVPLEDVQRLGRWASSKMLIELYSASDGDRLRSAANVVGDAMSE